MDKVDFPDLNTDQARRMALLVQLLEHCDEPEAALALAERMERFVLHGAPRGLTQGKISDPKALAVNAGIATGVPLVSQPHGRGAKKRRWTAEEDEKLRSLAAQDLSLEKIAAELGRTIISVRERARARQVKVKPRKRGRRPSRSDDKGSSQPSTSNGEAIGGHRPNFANGFRARGKRQKAAAGCSPEELKKNAEMVEKYLMERGATRQATSLDTVVKFLRTRDYSVVRADDGRYVVDERDHLTPAELVERANSLRLHLGQPAFPKDLAH